MKTIRWILLPLALIYGVITFLRNKFYDWNILKSYSIPGKSIGVGNLSVGGTGKSPHVDYLIQHLLAQNMKITTLSRGYGRTSKGVFLASEISSPSEIGDEPTQYKTRYGSNIEVVVSEKRQEGVSLIEERFPDNDVLLLDDAFQHRAVTVGMNILITPFNDLFTKDFMLPTGNLREWASGKNRADCIVVSKTPHDISYDEKKAILQSLRFDDKPIFFSTIEYDDVISINRNQVNRIEEVLIVTGIGNPAPLISHWQKKATVEHIAFPDHHNFTTKDIATIHEKFGIFASRNKVIITTEKDFMRLRSFSEVLEGQFAWYYQPITIKIDDQLTFNKLIDEYVTEI
ncbi:MAG: tetraacyldisaccharide 4'-kinase [Flavobacteriaceae bacterium]|jgi:tetraacyldisaccharide 4'-kinase